MKTLSKPQNSRPTPDSNHPLCRPRRLGLLLLGVALLLPGTLLAQAGSEKEPPGFSQTAEASAKPPAEPVPAANPPRSSPVPAAAPALPVSQRKCNCDWLRNGFYLRMASGMTHITLSGRGPSGSAKLAGLGGGTTILIGHSIVRGLVVAGMFQSNEVTTNFDGGPYADAKFSANGESITVTRKALASSSQIGVAIDWYPMENQGLHAGLSGGLSMITVNNYADESMWHGFGTAGSLFVGYDWPIASTWAMGVSLVVSGATSSSIKDKDSNQTGYNLKPFSIGLAGSLLYF